MEKRTIGGFITTLRKANGMTQKDLAERLNVSDKTVSRWERDDGAPALSLIPVIAEIFGVTCDELLRGERKSPEEQTEKIEDSKYSPKNEKQPQRFLKAKKLLLTALVFAIVLGGIGGSVSYIRSLPVDYDAGACGGGYATFIFDKYNEELTEKYVNGMADNSNISFVEAIRGTQEAEWDDQLIFLQFDIQYEHSTNGSVTERVRFIGERTWFDTYDWSGAMIVGDPQS